MTALGMTDRYADERRCGGLPHSCRSQYPPGSAESGGQAAIQAGAKINETHDWHRAGGRAPKLSEDDLETAKAVLANLERCCPSVNSFKRAILVSLGSARNLANFD
jgi:hypothetical protein